MVVTSGISMDQKRIDPKGLVPIDSPRSTSSHKFRVDMVSRVTNKLYTEFQIDFDKTVNQVIFCPFDNAGDILACATHERVYVFRIAFELDPSGEVKFDYQLIHDYMCSSRCTAIAFSPKTNFTELTNNYLSFAVAGDDFGILIMSQLFGGEQSENNSEQEYFLGHTDYVNDMAFEPISGDFLASTSDDCTCSVWSLAKGSQKINPDMKIMLSSPGISVKWHKSEPNKLFVAEKRGVIRFYDTNSRVAVMSFDCNRYPLVSSDWCNDNSVFIGCISGKDIFFWDTSLTTLPINVMKTNSEGLSEFEFYDSKLIAFRGRPNNFLQVKNFINNQVYINKEFIAGTGISWNRRLPVIAVGGSKAVYIYKINVF